MQFIKDGPEVPDVLLQAHEEGRVVFFCGAGISYPAGLPSFKNLVDRIYEVVGTEKTEAEESAFRKGSYDGTLGLLEKRLPGGREKVIEALSNALEPKFRRKHAKRTHSALLTLATTRQADLHLVTTNFDRIFEKLTSKRKPRILTHAAPSLPVPKKSRWNSLVYLHGLLPKVLDDQELNRLVLTSDDFGLAYLTERWAARFISELFRNYSVCFVGYSINDPVLQYMMEAIAADRMLGESSPQPYAFGDYEAGNEDDKLREWKAKGVTPILYEVPPGDTRHTHLHETLNTWAEIYRDGITGKELLVASYAITQPSLSTKRDDFVGRMLWAISDPSGLPAKKFAEFDPTPSISWLDSFSDSRYFQDDLIRYGVSPDETLDKDLTFSLIDRPSPYTLSPRMKLTDYGSKYFEWDNVMTELGNWLTKHLDDPTLLLWLADHGGKLHPRLKRLIEFQLNRYEKLVSDGDTAAIDRIRKVSPRAIPREELLPMWRLFLADRIRASGHQLGVHGRTSRLKHDGLTSLLRFQLREVLAPMITLKRPFFLTDEVPDEDLGLRSQINWELVLSANHANSVLDRFKSSLDWPSVLPELLGDFQSLLHDALELKKELGEIDADARSDRSYWDLPSIYPHSQNRSHKDWVLLIELLRDAWIESDKINSSKAADTASAWFELPYPTFKRLALFAAGNSQNISAERWTTWLEFDDARWLWSIETRRETLRLLVLKGSELDKPSQERLEKLILAGPARTLDQEDFTDEQFQEEVSRKVWLRLAKLESSGIPLSDKTKERFQQISQANPEWIIAANEKDEFPYWTSGTGDPDFYEHHLISITPKKRAELVLWLRDTDEPDGLFKDDNWKDTCQTRFGHSALALTDLAKDSVWPVGRWRTALQVWSEGVFVERSWALLAPLVIEMPNDAFNELVGSVAWWFNKVSDGNERQSEQFLNLSSRIIHAPYEDVDDKIGGPVYTAINHSIGITTQGLLKCWFRRNPNDNDGLPQEIAPLLTELCNTKVGVFRHGRTILASRLIPLFRIDREWTELNLLPLFDWGINEAEAKSAWEGFLWSPHIYPALLIAIKSQFLDTANHYNNLGGHAEQYATFLTYTALNSIAGFLPADFCTALNVLPQEGLEKAAQALNQAIEEAGEQREKYWDNQVEPFWHVCWPKNTALRTKNLADNLACVCISAGNRFPQALNKIKHWLQPLDYPDSIVDRLHEAKLSALYPEEALRLLDAIIDEQPFAPKELENCLQSISQARPDLQQRPEYIRLEDYYRKNRM